MKTKTTTGIFAISLMAILATGVLAPAVQEAYALKADNSQKLSPKAYGEKTKTKMTTADDSQNKQKSGFDTVKKEQAKNYKKIAAEYKAKQLIKDIYRLG